MRQRVCELCKATRFLLSLGYSDIIVNVITAKDFVSKIK